MAPDDAAEGSGDKEAIRWREPTSPSPRLGWSAQDGSTDRPVRARIRSWSFIRYPDGHFDIYVGELFERAVNDQLEFLTRHLLAGRGTTVTNNSEERLEA